MIYLINKKFVFYFSCLLTLILVLFIYINYNSITTFIDSPVEEELFFPAFKVRVTDEDKVIALTFDDGPTREHTTKILNYLEQKNVVATFFVLGIHLKNNDDILIDMVKNGCEIGNHSYNHKQFLYLKNDEIKKQIEYVDNYVRKITGFSIRAIRTPYGEYNQRIGKTINRPIVLWNLDSEDWKKKDASKIAEHVINNVENGSIILLHDIFDFSYEATILIVEELLSQGYKFVTVSQLLELNNKNANGIVFRSKQ